MIYDLKKSIDLRRLFDPVLHSSLDVLVESFLLNIEDIKIKISFCDLLVLRSLNCTSLTFGVDSHNGHPI